MGRVLSNNVALAYNKETALGIAGTEWFELEPEEIGSFGADITTVSRDPISKNRQRRKGTVTDLDSGVEFDHDFTLSVFQDFAEGFLFATAVNGDLDISSTNVLGTTDDYTVASLTAAQAGKLNFSAAEFATLIFARGHGLTDNDGLKSVNVDAVATDTIVSVAEVLVDEATPPAEARIELAGLRFLDGTTDLTYAFAGNTITLTVGAGIIGFDWANFGLTNGQFVYFGSPDGSGGVQNAFQNAVANDQFGYAQVVAQTATILTLSKASVALQNDAPTIPTTVDMLYGKFIRNVPVDDPDFLEQSFQIEATYPNLQGPGDEFEYSIGNLCNTMTPELPLTDKASVAFNFVGTDTEDFVTSQKTGADTPKKPIQTEALNTSQDIARLRILEVDETGLTTDFKSLQITMNNNVSPEKVLATLGARFMNFGNFEIDIEAQMLFTSSAVIARIKGNTTVSLDFMLRNGDGAIAFDVSAMTLSGGGREFPRNESVLVNLTAQAHLDPVLNTSIGVSIFPVVPLTKTT